MANLYLILGENNQVRGCQTGGKDVITEPGYVLVSEAIYNEYSRITSQVSPYQPITYKDKKLTVHPDPRPVVKIETVQTAKVSEPVTVGMEFTDQLSAEDSVLLMEYETPEGRIGLVRAAFRDGKAVCRFLPKRSGYYRFAGSPNYQPDNPVTISIYEE